jgi:CPA2 family monovalent cation:H+ antiporter-2
MPENAILSDLGIIAVACALVAIVFSKIKFPVILGYVIAGLFLGPFLFDHHLIHDRENVQALSELGVIFLLFTLGMEFDLKKLQHLLGTSLVAVVLQTFTMIYIGVQIAPMLGYDKTIGIFLGSLLSISSSMVTIRVLKDHKSLKHPHGQLAIGILILEDILAVILLVVLSGISATGSLPWGSAMWSIFILGIFVVGVFFIGRIVMPYIISIVHKIGSLELVTVFAVGSVLGIGVLAEQFHLSLALGAFVAGSLFTNSTLTHQIENSIAPIKELFSSIFFVSTGMLIDPQILIQEWKSVLLLAALVIIGKTVSCGVGLFLAGQKARSSFRAALAKSQIGEFSFVIAKLAQSMGLADEKLVSIAVGVSFITILSTPFAVQNSMVFYDILLKITPRPIARFGDIYHNFFCIVESVFQKTPIFKLTKRPFWQIITSFFLINGLFIGANLLSGYVVGRAEALPFETYIVVAIWMFTALLCAPFLLSIFRNLGAVSMIIMDMIFKGSKTLSKASHTFRQIIRHGIFSIFVFLVGGGFITALTEYLPSGYSIMLFMILILGLALLFRRQMIRFNSELEHRFASSFEIETKRLTDYHKQQALQAFEREFDWGSITTEHMIKHGSFASGKQIREMKLRENTGATIIAVSRGDEIIYDPNPTSHVFSGDTIVLLGNESQLNSAVTHLKQEQAEDDSPEDYTLHSEAVFINGGSFLEGNTLAGSELRNKHRITVVGIKRGDHPVMDPRPEEVLRAGDLLLILGKKSNVEGFKLSLERPQSASAA